ncbi:MAG: hypothetical protein HYR63_02880 [Proteobacteria bacterium]|nr:hypothetical protein [Pseudomonadota bacterium]MBI3496269.1 hypothetical protein [Pseudomonadota bacterium]
MAIRQKVGARILIVAGLLLWLMTPADALAAPVNDVFASATTITGVSGTVTGTTVLATREVGEPTHGGVGSGNSVWWKWTPTSTGLATFSTANSASNNVLAIYTGSAVNALTAVTLGSGGSQTTNTIAFFASAGSTYYIAVDGIFGVTGAVTLTWSQVTPPNSGWWWNPAEPGRGYAIEVTGISPLLTSPRIFFSVFGYDATGPALWYISTGLMSSPTSYTGTLDQYSGGQSLTGTFKPPTRLGSAGTLALSFTNQSTGTLTWPGGTVPIQRYEFTPGGLSLPQVTGAVQTGWWWNPAEPGRGYFVETQNSSILIGTFMYDTNGRATWFITQNTVTSAVSYAGRLFEYAGGQSMFGTFVAPSTVIDRGSLSVSFSSTTTGTVTLPSGTQVPISRFNF